jgi:hypothetical protein
MRPVQFDRFAEARIAACGIPFSHQLVIVRAVLAGIAAIRAATNSGVAADRMFRRNTTRHARMEMTVDQNAIVMNVSGYGSISKNNLGFYQSQ